MGERVFTIGEAIKEGWRLTKEHLGFLIGYLIILFILSVLFTGTHGDGTWKWAPLHLAAWIIVILAKMGLYNSSLLITAGQKPGFDQLYKNWRLFLSWVIASFLFGVMLVIGFILLIVPGCYVWAKYGFFPFFILDKDLGPLEALKQAGEATKGMRWPVFLFFLVCVCIDILGLLLFGIGLLITIPITLLAMAVVYRKLVKHKEASTEIAAPPLSQ